MATLVSIVEGAPTGGFAVGNQTLNYVVSVQNTGSSSLTLSSLSVAEATKTGMRVGQPVYLTPNVPVGVGNPTILPGATVSFGFQAVPTAPVMPGPSPQAPGGAAPSNAAYYPYADFTLLATAQTSDGSVASGSLNSPVATATFPQSNGGALVLSQGFNLLNFITL